MSTSTRTGPKTYHPNDVRHPEYATRAAQQATQQVFLAQDVRGYMVPVVPPAGFVQAGTEMMVSPEGMPANSGSAYVFDQATGTYYVANYPVDSLEYQQLQYMQYMQQDPNAVAAAQAAQGQPGAPGMFQFPMMPTPDQQPQVDAQGQPLATPQSAPGLPFSFPLATPADQGTLQAPPASLPPDIMAQFFQPGFGQAPQTQMQQPPPMLSNPGFPPPMLPPFSPNGPFPPYPPPPLPGQSPPPPSNSKFLLPSPPSAKDPNQSNQTRPPFPPPAQGNPPPFDPLNPPFRPPPSNFPGPFPPSPFPPPFPGNQPGQPLPRTAPQPRQPLPRPAPGQPPLFGPKLNPGPPRMVRDMTQDIRDVRYQQSAAQPAPSSNGQTATSSLPAPGQRVVPYTGAQGVFQPRSPQKRPAPDEEPEDAERPAKSQTLEADEDPSRAEEEPEEEDAERPAKSQAMEPLSLDPNQASAASSSASSSAPSDSPSDSPPDTSAESSPVGSSAESKLAENPSEEAPPAEAAEEASSSKAKVSDEVSSSAKVSEEAPSKPASSSAEASPPRSPPSSPASSPGSSPA